MMEKLQAFTAYLSHERRYSEHTVIAYKNDLEQFFQFIASQYSSDLSEAEVKATMIKSWIYALSQDKMAAKSINRKLVALNSFYKYLLRQGALKVNPVSAIRSVKTEKRLYQWLPEKDMEFLLDDVDFGDGFAGLRDKLIIELFYGSGIRRAELIGLKQEAVDLKERTIKVLGKRNKERIIPVPDSLRLSIEMYMAEKSRMGFGNTGPLILTNDGKPLYAMFAYRCVKRYIGLVSTLQKQSPHVLRHTYATHLLNQGAEIGAIKELLGHSSLAATQIYTHNSIERLKDIYKLAHPKGKKA